MRNLEREIGAVLRHAAVRVAEGDDGPVRIDPAIWPPSSGRAPLRGRSGAMRTAMPGVATGLAWTPVGGDILFIEATAMPGSGKLILTGQLGEVMKESAQAALSLVKIARGRTSASIRRCSSRATSMSMCRPARPRRMARARALRCSWRSSR